MAASSPSGLEHPPKTGERPSMSLPCSGTGCPSFTYSHEKAYLHFMSQCDKLKAAPQAFMYQLSTGRPGESGFLVRHPISMIIRGV